MTRSISPLIFLLSLPALASDEDETCGELGDSSLFAAMPDDGPSPQPTGRTYPEGVAVVKDIVAVSGPATFGTAGNGSPSQLTLFDRESGELLAEIPVVGEDLAYEHALSELAAHKGRVFAPSTQLGLLAWDLKRDGAAAAQESVSTPFCSVTFGFPCVTPTDLCPADLRPGLPPLPNGVTVGKDGVAYITDSLQGVVWRVDTKAAPAAPEPVVCSPLLQGAGSEGLTMFGANGVAVVEEDLYVGVTFAAPDASGVFSSAVYRVSLAESAEPELVYSFGGLEVAPGVVIPPIADGLRYNEDTGTLFVVLGGQNAVAELDIGGPVASEIARYTRTEADHPFMNPSTIAFGEDGEAYVTNHAIMCCLEGDPNPACGCYGEDHFGVIELCLE